MPSDPSAVEAVARIRGAIGSAAVWDERREITELFDDTLAELERLRAENERYERKIHFLQWALSELEEYTAELWYGTPTLKGKTETVVRTIRGKLGAYANALDQPTERPQTIPGEEWSQAPQEES